MDFNITRKSIDTGILDNDPDKLGNKIKLREISKYNLSRHVGNIPFDATSVVNNVTEATIPNNEPVKSVVSIEKEKPQFTIIDRDYDRSFFTAGKPINVRTNMFNNIAMHGNIVYNSDNLNANYDSKPEIVNDTPIVPAMDNTDSIQNAPIDVNNSVNDNKSFEQIANEREYILNVKAEAEKAQNEVKKSDDELSKISIEDTETQKMLEAALKRQRELSEQITNALKNQSATLEKMKKQFESIINDANRRKEENQNKIMQFQNKILNTKKQITEIEDDNAKKQEFLNALSQDENIASFENPTFKSEQPVFEKRIA